MRRISSAFIYKWKEDGRKKKLKNGLSAPLSRSTLHPIAAAIFILSQYFQKCGIEYVGDSRNWQTNRSRVFASAFFFFFLLQYNWTMNR